jgi:hypothetical protein
LHQISNEVSTNNEITFSPNFGGGKHQQWNHICAKFWMRFAPTMKSHLHQILDWGKQHSAMKMGLIM